MRLPGGQLVPLSAVTTQQEVPVLQAINHADRERAITIFGNVAPGHSQTEALAYIQSLTSEVPTGYRIVLSGQSSQFQDSMNSLLFALGLGILVAYMVLASQFNSFLHPVTVLSILPLAVAGAVLGLYFIGTRRSTSSQHDRRAPPPDGDREEELDHPGRLREPRGGVNGGHADDCAAMEAMQQAGPVRLRPIVMTSVATMMSAIPAALGLGPGAETRAPMADAVLGGLILCRRRR